MPQPEVGPTEKEILETALLRQKYGAEEAKVNEFSRQADMQKQLEALVKSNATKRPGSRSLWDKAIFNLSRNGSLNG
jgi:hypothetical protein